MIPNPEPQLVLDDSARIRDMLQDFRPVLAEISAVCDVGTQEKTLDHNDQRVHQMQRNLLEPLEQLLQAAVVSVMKLRILTSSLLTFEVFSDPQMAVGGFLNIGLIK